MGLVHRHHQQAAAKMRRWLLVAIGLAAIALNASRVTVAQTITIDRVVAELEPEIQRTLIEGRIPSAAIALIAGDRVIWTSAYGYSNLWSRTPATPSTVYLIGSTFKAMSTVALLQQMEQGKFKLDDRVNDYLTDFKIQNEDPQHPVTFRQLLTHTSGLPADFGPVPVWSDSAPPPLEEYLRKSLKVAKPPLTFVVCSNLAYTLIGYLVQASPGWSSDSPTLIAHAPRPGSRGPGARRFQTRSISRGHATDLARPADFNGTLNNETALT